jgi:hypothetical protein
VYVNSFYFSPLPSDFRAFSQKRDSAHIQEAREEKVMFCSVLEQTTESISFLSFLPQSSRRFNFNPDPFTPSPTITHHITTCNSRPGISSVSKGKPASSSLHCKIVCYEFLLVRIGGLLKQENLLIPLYPVNGKTRVNVVLSPESWWGASGSIMFTSLTRLDASGTRE